MGTRRVIVTGACGNIGARLVPLLLDDPRIERVFGVDVAPQTVPARSNWMPVRLDVRSPDVRSLFREADCLVHLAFVVRNIRDDEETRRINIGGTENLLEACAKAGLKRIVFTSSVSVYGDHPDNRPFLKEQTPLRPDPRHVYSACKAWVEARLERFARESPGTGVCVLRPALVMGPRVNNSLANLFRRNRFLVVNGFDPRVQAVHVDDVARALHLAVREDARGVFNVAARDAPRVSEICGRFRIRRVRVPRGLFESYLRLGYRTGLSHIPPQSVTRFLYPPTVDSGLFRTTFGWRPVHTTLRCIADLRSGVDAGSEENT